jgi:Ribbon-helix-helix protein, copG family
MKNQTRTERNNSKVKGRTQHRRGRFESAISFSVGEMGVTVRIPAELKGTIARGARKLNISTADFIARRAAQRLVRWAEKNEAKKERPERRGRFNNAISFSVRKKRVSFRSPAALKSIVERAAKKGNISVAEFVRRAISEHVYKGADLNQKFCRAHSQTLLQHQ